MKHNILKLALMAMSMLVLPVVAAGSDPGFSSTQKIETPVIEFSKADASATWEFSPGYSAEDAELCASLACVRSPYCEYKQRFSDSLTGFTTIRLHKVYTGSGGGAITCSTGYAKGNGSS